MNKTSKSILLSALALMLVLPTMTLAATPTVKDTDKEVAVKAELKTCHTAYVAAVKSAGTP